jgi:hypothetical protein
LILRVEPCGVKSFCFRLESAVRGGSDNLRAIGVGVLGSNCFNFRCGILGTMNVERTMQFILESQAKAEVRMDRAEARMDKAEKRAEREMAAMRKLLGQGLKALAELAAAQKETDRALKETDRALKETDRVLRTFIKRSVNGRNGRNGENN